MRWGAILLVGAAVGCEGARPTSKVCVTTDVTGTQLRAMAGYFADSTMFDLMDDVPFDGDAACLAFRPPRVLAGEPSSIEFATQDRSFELPVRAIDVAVYDDLNRNGQIDPGELRGRLSAQEERLPVWMEDYELLLRIYLWIDPFADETLALREYAFGYVSVHSSTSSYFFETLPEQLHVPDAPGCAPDRYPQQVGRDFDSTFDHIALWAPGYEESGDPAPVLDAPLPVDPDWCESLGGGNSYAAFWFSNVVETEPGRCTRHEQTINLYYDAGSKPAWLICPQDQAGEEP